MNNERLPVGWIEKPLGKLVTFQKGKKTETSDTWQAGYLRYLGASGLQGLEDGYAATSGAVLAGAKDLLMLWDGERSGLVGCGQVGVVASTVARMVPNDDILPEYLYYFLDLHFAWIQARRTGTGVPHVPKDLGRILSVRYPSDKDRQKKVVDILQSIDMVIHNTLGQINKLSVTKEGMMADLFSRGIDPTTGQLRPSVQDAPELYHETPIGLLPRDWCISKLSCIADVIDPQPDHRTPPQDEHGIPYVGISDFQDDEEIDSYNCRLVSLSVLEKQKQRFLVESGDIIFGKIGTIGQPKMIRGTGDFALSANILLIKPATGFSRFLYEFMKSDLIDIQLSKIVNITSQPAIGINTMRELTIPIPTENELQYINRSMDSIESHLWSELKMLSKLKFQKVGLMQDLLTGKVPVSA